ncbi:MAG: YHYH protein [Bacteroidota bacterium]|nr:YHYH protein [Bacteroidota bacterium]
MKIKFSILSLVLLFTELIFAQSNPAIISWLQNTTVTGSYYIQGNSTPIPINTLVNCQEVSYTANDAFIRASGIPSYPTGPFLDGNPSQAANQNAIYKIPLSPIQNLGTPISTNMGAIGIFINGVALFDYRDGVSWNPNTNALCGGPGNPPCPGGPGAIMNWNRDAILAEMDGFDCSKGHPARGNYHHHQNPSAFDMDLNVVSSICNLYDADGLYSIDSTQHSPLIGFAFDGFPIYGAYGYLNTDGSGGITRIQSSFELKSSRGGGNTPSEVTWPLGYFKEDYQFVNQSGPEYLDEHNGRFCVTPEYPNGTYAYFATVDEDWNSKYPYVVAPTYYGQVNGGEVSAVPNGATLYTSSFGVETIEIPEIKIFPNPSSELLTLQVKGLLNNTLTIRLVDLSGRILQTKTIHAGQTIGYFETDVLHNGAYFLEVSNGRKLVRKRILIQH